MSEPKQAYAYRIVGNAWKKEASTGNIFLSIALKEDIGKDTSILMWPNTSKRPDKQDPDWVLKVKND